MLDTAGQELPTSVQALCDDVDVPLEEVVRIAEARVTDKLLKSTREYVSFVEYMHERDLLIAKTKASWEFDLYA